MLVVVTIFSKLGSTGAATAVAASDGFNVSFLSFVAAVVDVTILVGLALDINSLAIGLGDDFKVFDFGGFNFRFFGFFSDTRLSQGSKISHNY